MWSNPHSVRPGAGQWLMRLKARSRRCSSLLRDSAATVSGYEDGGAAHGAVAQSLDGRIGVVQREGLHMGLQRQLGHQLEERIAISAREIGHRLQHALAPQ